MALPKHRDPRQDRRATAPYNFVPLPEHPVVFPDDEIEELLPRQDRYDGDLRSGYIDCHLTTETHLYVRGPLSLDEFERQEASEDDQEQPYYDQLRNKSAFFYTAAKDPCIPGSSLRGMLRNLVDIAAYGKMEWITRKNLFFRTVDNSAVGDHYRDQFSVASAPRGGFWSFHADGSAQIEECAVAEVFMDEAAKALGLRNFQQLYQGRGPNATPKWEYQHQTVWVQVEDASSRGQSSEFGKVTDIKAEKADGYQPGTLVLTGPMPKKKRAFVFLNRSEPTRFTVDRDLVKRFHDDDQVTRWQRSAFPKNKPQGAHRRGDGGLRDGEPVFFLTEEKNGDERVRFFGRARLFRLPYAQRPVDLVPESQRSPNNIDLADAIFGFAKSGKRDDDVPQSVAGRISVRDGVLSPRQTAEACLEERVTPRILSEPKPTAFQLYLVQQSDAKRSLRHYDTGNTDTTVRGHKLYWHSKNGLSLGEFSDSEATDDSTQHTCIRPVKPGTEFTFRIHFENLRDRELGALLWVLALPGAPGREYRHKLGMGKPLGLGSVKIDIHKLHLSDRESRYEQLFHETRKSWHLPAESDEVSPDDLIRSFETFVLEQLGESTDKRLADLPRIRELLTMLEWPGPDPEHTQYMELDDFKKRLVLPTPSGVVDPEAPNPGPHQSPATSTSQQRSGPQASKAEAPSQSGEELLAELARSSSAKKEQPPRIGDKVKAEVIAREGSHVTVRVQGHNGEEVSFELPYYPKQVGDQVRLKVTDVDADGRIVGVHP